jgi:hypothetical protein
MDTKVTASPERRFEIEVQQSLVVSLFNQFLTVIMFVSGVEAIVSRYKQ